MAEAALSLIETTIGTKTVRMLLADNPDPKAEPTEWIEFEVIPGEYEIAGRKLSEDQDRMPLAATYLAALRRAQAVIAAEIARHSGQALRQS